MHFCTRNKIFIYFYKLFVNVHVQQTGQSVSVFLSKKKKIFVFLFSFLLCFISFRFHSTTIFEISNSEVEIHFFLFLLAYICYMKTGKIKLPGKMRSTTNYPHQLGQIKTHSLEQKILVTLAIVIVQCIINIEKQTRLQF